MRTILFSILVLFCSLSVAENLSDYRLGSGDKIKIQVFGEDDLGMEVRLSDAGTISYPFMGEIQVKGLTVGQLENHLIAGLKPDYLIDPKVSVSIVEYRRFYIHGEVKNPGGIPYLPGLTLRKAIALAGGFTERASRSKIYVVHDGMGDLSDKSLLIGLGDQILPGDIITVEQSFF